MTHDDRQRAETFGDHAERYDRARPSYPSALVDLLVEGGPRRVLDVGCGTGKAGQLLIERGIEVLGVEVDERMAAVSRRRGLSVEVTAFEDWNPEGRRFPLLISGQAWHWVDPLKGAAKAAQVLSPGGTWAAFWNQDEDGFEPHIRECIDAVYERYCPELRHRDTDPSDDQDDPIVAGIDACGSFTPVEEHWFEWDEWVEPASYTERVSTHSDHLILPEPTRSRLLVALRMALHEAGGPVHIHQRTLLLSARLR